MDLCRGTQEVEAVLSESGEAAERDPLARLKMAIRYEEKKVIVLGQSCFLFIFIIVIYYLLLLLIIIVIYCC